MNLIYIYIYTCRYVEKYPSARALSTFFPFIDSVSCLSGSETRRSREEERRSKNRRRLYAGGKRGQPTTASACFRGTETELEESKVTKSIEEEPSLVVKEEREKMTRMLLQEPGWKIERKGSALLLRRDSSHLKSGRVCFRCDVEVREFERDEDYMIEAEPEAAASPLAMCASCLAALCVTVILPWLLIGG